jgi:hypothetical protein
MPATETRCDGPCSQQLSDMGDHLIVCCACNELKIHAASGRLDRLIIGMSFGMHRLDSAICVFKALQTLATDI